MTKNTFVAEVTFKYQLHKTVKRTLTIRRLLPRDCLSVFDHLVELTLKELKSRPT